MRPMTRSSDAGSAMLLLVAVVALTAGALAALGHLARAAVEAAQARTAADAAALAAAAAGGPAAEGPGTARAEAARLAGANGGRLVHFVLTDDGVVVRVQVGRAAAEARAVLELVPAQ